MRTTLRTLMASLVAAAALGSVALPANAGSPAAFTMTTVITFPNVGLATGTFTSTGPICSSGTVRTVFFEPNAGVGAFSGNVRVEYTCDDNSGTFALRYTVQANPGNATNAFLLSGPWSVLGKGTGRYARMSGHGEMGFNWVNPPTGTETFVGFVQLD